MALMDKEEKKGSGTTIFASLLPPAYQGLASIPPLTAKDKLCVSPPGRKHLLIIL